MNGSHTRNGLVISLCFNTNSLVSLIPPNHLKFFTFTQLWHKRDTRKMFFFFQNLTQYISALLHTYSGTFRNICGLEAFILNYLRRFFRKYHNFECYNFFVFRLRNVVTSDFVVQLLHLLRVKPSFHMIVDDRCNRCDRHNC